MRAYLVQRRRSVALLLRVRASKLLLLLHHLLSDENYVQLSFCGGLSTNPNSPKEQNNDTPSPAACVMTAQQHGTIDADGDDDDDDGWRRSLGTSRNPFK